MRHPEWGAFFYFVFSFADAIFYKKELLMPDLASCIHKNDLSPCEIHQLCSTTTEERTTLLQNARALSRSEIVQLEKQGNSAVDWDTIKVASNFNPQAIHKNSFHGFCYLGFFSGEETLLHSSATLPNGVYNSTIYHSVIADNCTIRSCALIANYYIESNAHLFNCGTIAADQNTSFGNGFLITLGNETGGRVFPVFAEMSIDEATSAAYSKEFRSTLLLFVNRYKAAMQTGFGTIGSYAMVTNCRSITNVFIGEGGVIDNATSVDTATILSSKHVPTTIASGAIVRNSCLQWGSSVETLAIVERSLITEHAHVERHGKVTNSIIGPNTGIAEGEVTSSLVGPFVGFHHQALLIGTLWPQGKGNVAYGANVGSNHTAKAPDQELYSGEGFFYGLGVNIKFPTDFSQAPYSIIATGVTTLPQRMTFPFSLINTPSKQMHGLSPAINELFPAWVLSDNMFLVKRNEAKFASRNKATRTKMPLVVFRSEIIDLIINAKKALCAAPHPKEYYTDTDIPGIGKNFITHKNVQSAIDTYNFCIEQYCLQGMFRWLQQLHQFGNIAALFISETMDDEWEHCRLTALAEGYTSATPATLLDRLSFLQEHTMQSIIDSKRRDMLRGRKIMRDYDDAHSPAEEDPFIVSAQKQHHTLLQEIQMVKIALIANESAEESIQSKTIIR